MKDFESQCWICPICGDDHVQGGSCDPERTPMSDDVFEKWKDSTVGLASIAFFDHAKEMEMRLNKAMFALRGIKPNLRGLLFDSDLILTMEFEEAIKAVLAVVDTPNPTADRRATAQEGTHE